MGGESSGVRTGRPGGYDVDKFPSFHGLIDINDAERVVGSLGSGLR